MLDGDCEEESSHLVRHSFSLKLSISTDILPVIFGELSKINVGCFRDERTRTDCPVTGGQVFVLAMTFMQDYGMGSVHFIDSSNFYVLQNLIKKKLEMEDSSLSSIQIVSCSDREEVRDGRSDTLEEAFSFLETNSWDRFARFANFYDLSVVFSEAHIAAGRDSLGSLEVLDTIEEAVSNCILCVELVINLE